MKKVVAVLAVAVVALAGVVGYTYETKPWAQYVQAQEAARAVKPLPLKSIVLLELKAPDENGEWKTVGNGSGVFIDYKGRKDIILTAAHVTAAIEQGARVFLNGKEVVFLGSNKELDVALVWAPGVEGEPLKVADKSPAIGEDVVTIGFPLQYAIGLQVVTKGQFQGEFKDRMISTAPAAAGNSGGAIVHYEGGEWKVVGILIEVAVFCLDDWGMKCSPVSHLTRGASVPSIHKFLSDVADKVKEIVS